MQRLFTTAIGFFAAAFTTISFATTPSFLPATKIQNLKSAIAAAKQSTTVPLLFPQQIATRSGTKQYFASNSQFKGKNDYLINVDSTAQCQGVHVCNIGSVAGRQNAKPDMNYDRNKQLITKPVTLINHTKGFFTPGHALGDFHPAEVQWFYNKVLYTIIWDTDESSLIAMANSAIKAGPR